MCSNNQDFQTIQVVSLDFDGCANKIFQYDEEKKNYTVNTEHTLYKAIQNMRKANEKLIIMIGSNRQSDRDDPNKENHGRAIEAFQELTNKLNENTKEGYLSVEYDQFRLCDIENKYKPWKCKANLLAHQAHHIAEQEQYKDKKITLTLIDDCGPVTENEAQEYINALDLTEDKKQVNEYYTDPKQTAIYDIITPTHTLFSDFSMLLPKNVHLKLQTYLRLKGYDEDKLCEDSIKSIQGIGITQKDDSLKTIFDQVNDKYEPNENLVDNITQPSLHQYMYDTLCQNHLSEYIDYELTKWAPTNPLSSHRSQLTYYNFLSNTKDLIVYLQKQLQQKDRLFGIDQDAYQTILNLLQLERINIIKKLKKAREDALLGWFSKQYEIKQEDNILDILLPDHPQKFELTLNYQPSELLIKYLNKHDQHVLASLDRIQKHMQGRNPDAITFLQKLIDLIQSKLLTLLNKPNTQLNYFSLFKNTCQKEAQRYHHFTNNLQQSNAPILGH